MAERIQDFEVWHKAKAFWEAVNAIVQRDTFSRDWDLRNEIRDALDSITSNMEEGFEQPTDRSFANYLYTSKGSTAEVCGRLDLACKRKHLNATELRDLTAMGDEIRRMTTGLIKYLHKSNRRDRGTGKTKDQRAKDQVPSREKPKDQRPETKGQGPTTRPTTNDLTDDQRLD